MEDVFWVNFLDVLKTYPEDVFGTGDCPLGMYDIVSLHMIWTLKKKWTKHSFGEMNMPKTVA